MDTPQRRSIPLDELAGLLGIPERRQTPSRSLRISDTLWASAREAAAHNEETITAVVVRALRDYVERYRRETAGGTDA